MVQHTPWHPCVRWFRTVEELAQGITTGASGAL